MENFYNQEMSEEHQIVLDELLGSGANIEDTISDNLLNEMSTTFDENFIDDFFRDLEVQNEFGTENLEPIFPPLPTTSELSLTCYNNDSK